MSRVTLGVSWLLVAVCLFFLNPANAQVADGEGVGAPAGGYGASSEHHQGESANPPFASVEDIELMLNSPLRAPLQYEDQPLNEIINELQETYNLPIVFDISALEGFAISPETEITINLRNITLRSALNLIFRQPGLEDLTYVVDDEVLLITTEEKANEKMVVQVYRVDDLIKDYPQQISGEKNPYSSLAQVITSCVAWHTWMANGKGEGEIQLMLPGILVITNTREVHNQVEDLLEKLRSVHKEINKSDSGGGNF